MHIPQATPACRAQGSLIHSVTVVEGHLCCRVRVSCDYYLAGLHYFFAGTKPENVTFFCCLFFLLSYIQFSSPILYVEIIEEKG